MFSGRSWESFLDSLPATVTVVLDEAYIDFVNDPDIPHSLEYVSEQRPLVGLRTFSKAYGLAGLRVGYGFGPSELMDYLNRLRLPFNINRLAQVGARAALTDADFLERTRKVVLTGRAYLEAGLTQLGLTFVPSQANFILVSLGRAGKEVYQAMLKEGVIIRAMDAYGFPEHIRVNVGLPQENERFIAALKKVLGL